MSLQAGNEIPLNYAGKEISDFFRDRMTRLRSASQNFGLAGRTTVVVPEEFLECPNITTNGTLESSAIPKRELVKIRNAVAAVFYVENSTPEEIAGNRRELISLLSAAFRQTGAPVINAIIDRLTKTHKLPKTSTNYKISRRF